MTAAIRIFALSILLLALQVHAAAPSTADEVLQRYIAAVGGSERLGSIQSRTMETKMSVGWLSTKVSSRSLYPNHFEQEASFLGKRFGSGYDGTTGWKRDGSKVTEVSGKELKRLLREHSLDWDRQLTQWYPIRNRLPDAQLDGTTLHVVEMMTDTEEREIWRFDAETGLLKQLERSVQDDPAKPAVLVVSTVDEYREVDGIRLPFKISGVGDSKTFTMTVESVQHNQPQAPIRAPSKN